MKNFILAVALATASFQAYGNAIEDDYIEYKNQVQHKESVVALCVFMTEGMKVLTELDMTVEELKADATETRAQIYEDGGNVSEEIKRLDWVTATSIIIIEQDYGPRDVNWVFMNCVEYFY
jgi:hypothetical protein